jgi:Protein of unknown function DUF262
MGLQEEIASQSVQIRTDSYSMSIGELLNLYRDEELDVHPEFQRVYRWTPLQKSRLIESLLLGIPIPPIFVAQRKSGKWDVVDGVQRLSTIFQFVGALKQRDGTDFEPLVLEGTKFLPSLAGKSWRGDDPFSKSQQLYIKRAKLDVKIVLKESDDKAKYELFMRLNTGGSVPSAQEIRNCLMVMAYPETYDWIKSLSDAPNFRHTLSLSDRNVDEQYHMELATRFLTFRRLPEDQLSGVGDIGDFLNDHLEPLHNMSVDQKAAEERAFSETFRLINNALEDDAFTRFDAEKKRFTGGFSISAFEVVAMGIGFGVRTDGKPNTLHGLKKKVEDMWSNDVFINNSGSGVRASVRIPKLVPLGRRIFANGENPQPGQPARRTRR